MHIRVSLWESARFVWKKLRDFIGIGNALSACCVFCLLSISQARRCWNQSSMWKARAGRNALGKHSLNLGIEKASAFLLAGYGTTPWKGDGCWRCHQLGRARRPFPREPLHLLGDTFFFMVTQHRFKTWRSHAGRRFGRCPHFGAASALEAWKHVSWACRMPGQRGGGFLPFTKFTNCITLSALLAWEFDKFLILKPAIPKLHLPGSVKSQAELIVV